MLAALRKDLKAKVNKQGKNVAEQQREAEAMSAKLAAQEEAILAEEGTANSLGEKEKNVCRVAVRRRPSAY